MINLYLQQKIVSTKEFLAIKSSLQSASLSHAILLVSNDKLLLDNFTTLLTCLYVCNAGQSNAENNAGQVSLLGGQASLLDINAQSPCAYCAECRKILNGTSVDVFTYPTKDAKTTTLKKKIYAEDVSEIINQSIIKPFGEKKIFVLKEIDSTIEQATQNRLLKLLEEPPKNVYFILSATSLDNVLPTIKSRVSKVALPMASASQISDYLLDEGATNDEARLVSSLVSTYEKASAFLQPAYITANNVIIDILKTVGEPNFFVLSNARLAKDRDSLFISLDVLEIILNKVLLLQIGQSYDTIDSSGNKSVANKGSLGSSHIAEHSLSADLKEIAKALNKKKVVAVLDQIIIAREQLVFNVNVQVVTDALLLALK
ncbi:MAG: hypothetical protein FWB72_03590 [Firmicutes bacterium]|nr:hypothetical protein [Bacillota bacterium]